MVVMSGEAKEQRTPDRVVGMSAEAKEQRTPKFVFFHVTESDGGSNGAKSPEPRWCKDASEPTTPEVAAHRRERVLDLLFNPEEGPPKQYCEKCKQPMCKGRVNEEHLGPRCEEKAKEQSSGVSSSGAGTRNWFSEGLFLGCSEGLFNWIRRRTRLSL